MIFHYVNPAFDRAQNWLASIERNAFIDKSKVERNTIPNPEIFGKSSEQAKTEQSVFANRLLAVPVVAIDLSLEGIRSIALVVESAVSTVISLIAFLCLIPQLPSLNELGKPLRITLLNLNNMVENTVFGVMKMVAIPFLTLAQLWIAIADPLTYLPSSENFPICYNLKPESLQEPRDVLTPHENDPIQFQAQLYGREIKDENSDKIRIPKNNHGIFANKRDPNRFALIPIACIDAGSDIALAVAYTIYHAVSSVVRLMGTIYYSFNSQVRANASLQLYANYRISFSLLNSSLYQLSHAISRVVMLPITLVSQITKTQWDPKNAQPISEQLYRPHKRDQFMTYEGRGEYGYDKA